VAVGAVFFDLFGTLLSLDPLDDACDRLAPGRGAEIAARWRTRQLEASWLRTAMERWADFDVITVDALRATLEELGIRVDRPSGPDAVANAFVGLPLAGGAGRAVRTLHDAGLVTGVLTNASARTVERVASRLDLPLDHLLSVDAARRFKPHPGVYQLAVDATGLPTERIGFVSANGWDAAGACAFGFRVAWLRAGPSATLPAVGAPEPIVATWSAIPSIFLEGSGRDGGADGG
jgi:2-haloacid dehalogenase